MLVSCDAGVLLCITMFNLSQGDKALDEIVESEDRVAAAIPAQKAHVSSMRGQSNANRWRNGHI